MFWRCLVYMVLFFKQKTAYEMRISDWSSDVCSSDLDYNKMFSTKETIFQHIFGNRNKTEDIIQSREFLVALSASPNAQLVDSVIADEAAKGDIPSLTYMMRLVQLHLEGLEQNVPAADRKSKRLNSSH